MTDQEARGGRWYLSMRWKLLAAFTTAFTIVFAAIAIWVLNYASDVAMKRLREQLIETTEGAARDLPKRTVAEVVALPPDTDPAANRSYRRIKSDLESVRATIPEAHPYTIVKNPDGSLDYLVSPDGPFRDPVLNTTPASTIPYMRNGFRATTFEPQNTDAFGDWISAYSPVVDRQGETVAVVGMDFSVEHVTDVRQQARRQVFPVLLVSYVLLVVLVMLVSTLIVRPLRRLTSATKRIADGDYDLDLTGITRSRLPDEMSELANSFRIMTSKVAARERALTSQVQRLQIEIDATKREESVREITETDFFSDLAAKAQQMRARLHDPQ